MGNSATTVCAGPVDIDHSFDVVPAVIPTDEELDLYLKEVKNAVIENVETIENRYKRYLDALTMTPEVLKLAQASFTDELHVGLACHAAHPTETRNEECSFKNLDSCVPRQPTGKEHGVYYALDFGGTNVRIVRVNLDHGKAKVTAKRANLMECPTGYPKGLMDPKATASEMFDFFANLAFQFLTENGDIESKTEFPVGFTFSYPCTMHRIDSASLIIWTKMFETGRETDDPVEGADVALLMNQAFHRKGLPLRVNCVVNDTVGTLISRAYTLTPEEPPCAVGLILGTGMNACYVQERHREWNYMGSVINIECGNFNRDTLPRINIDSELDFEDVGGRGQQHLEKMVSGAYIGDLCRRALVKVLQQHAPRAMFQPGSFSAEDAAVIVGDRSKDMIVVKRKCQEVWSVDFSPKELEMVKGICIAVFKRAAALAAVLIAGCAVKTGRLQEAVGGLTVGIDGSLYKCNQFFRDDIRHYLDIILGPKQSSLVNLTFAEDGSGLGAAILAAVVAQN